MKSESQILAQTREFVKTKMSNDAGGHDWWHVARVVGNAKTIAETEGGDKFVIELGALLHDVADWKFHDGDVTAGPKIARDWLREMSVNDSIADKVTEIVEHISFRGGTNKHVMQTLEAEIVQDADRLDALGAIGIARVFAVGEALGKTIYNPDIPPRSYDNFKAYRNNLKDSPTVNHFYEKLLLLKDKMNTSTGRSMAEYRHGYMEGYLKEFFAEWDGEK
jgi:uncharacterized protein